jgi:hypothetical protein
MNHVTKLKDDICPNDGFVSKLIALEKKLYGEVSMKLVSRPRKNGASGAGRGTKVRGRKRGMKRGKAW